MALATLSKAVAAAALALVLAQDAQPNWGAWALPACAQLNVALSPSLAGKPVVAGKSLKVTASLRNTGQAGLTGLGVKITLPPSWVVSSSKASPLSRRMRKSAIVEGVNAFWVNMPLAAGKKRQFTLRVRVPACQPPASALNISIAAFDTDGTNVTCITVGTPRQVGGDKTQQQHDWDR